MIVGESKKGKRFIIATPTKCGTTSMESLAHRLARAAGGPEPEFRIMDWGSPRRQHRMALPPTLIADDPLTVDTYGPGMPHGSWGDARRYLITRNPYRRYMSVYEYLRAPANYSQWGAAWVQGWEWPPGMKGIRPFKREADPMNFGEFLVFLADARLDPYIGTYGHDRDDPTLGRAYRSPWVWTDPLDFSLSALETQPGGGRTSTLFMERLWGPRGGMARLVSKYGLGVEVGTPPHTNRSKASTTPPQQYWATWPHSARVYNADGQFRPFRASFVERCDCPPCRIGVWTEAVVLGYMNAG